MSKSIKQYKDAMDNIRISDSFLKRTETLLKEMPENETVAVSNKNVRSIKHITFAAGLGAAACIAAVIAIGPGLVRDDIAVESATEAVTSVTEVTAPNETIYIDIENDDQIFIPAADAALLEEESSQDEADAGADTTAVQAEPAKTEAVYADETTVTVQNEAPKKTQTAPKVTETAADADLSAEETNEELPEIRYLYDIDYSNAEVELVAYINSSNGVLISGDSEAGEEEDDSGEDISGNPSKSTDLVILDDSAAEKLVTAIGDAVYSSEIISDGRYGRTLFAVTVNNITTGEKAFDIILNENKTATVTVYTATGSFFTSYALSDEAFAKLEKAMFLHFGSESNYIDYTALRSGN